MPANNIVMESLETGMQFRFTKIVLNSMLTALSFTQALAWKTAIDKMFVSLLPDDTDGILSSFLMAGVVTTSCIAFAWIASKCLKGLDDGVESLTNIAEVEIVQVSNNSRSRTRNHAGLRNA